MQKIEVFTDHSIARVSGNDTLSNMQRFRLRIGYLISNTRKALIYAKKEMKSQDKKLAAKWKK